MILKIKKRIAKEIVLVISFIFLFFWLTVGTSVLSPSVHAVNITNRTVLAIVNITNTEPYLYDVFITEDPIDLNAGASRTVICNGSYSDSNGFADVENVTGILFHHTVEASDADDNNNHYTNDSCGSCAQVTGFPNNGTCSCQFAVEYYANNGTWSCNMTIGDSGGLNSSNVSDPVEITETLGIGVGSLTQDYGNMSASQTSDPTIRQNVTNLGNIPMNVTIFGYGGGTQSIGENVSMICETGANITFEDHRFGFGNTTIFDDMYNLSNQSRQMPTLTIPSRQNDALRGNDTNATYWRLRIPVGAGGFCNGTLVFGAVEDFLLYN